MLLSSFIHKRQRHETDCLVACAEMLLNYLGITIPELRLRKFLRAGINFTPFSNLSHLQQLALSVRLGEQAAAAMFEDHLLSGLPVIVAVKTVGWNHWGDIVTEHAVVVVGIDRPNDKIFIHDPYFADSPIEMSLLAFEIGWQEKDRQYAVIGLAAL